MFLLWSHRGFVNLSWKIKNHQTIPKSITVRIQCANHCHVVIDDFPTICCNNTLQLHKLLLWLNFCDKWFFNLVPWLHSLKILQCLSHKFSYQLILITICISLTFEQHYMLCSIAQILCFLIYAVWSRRTSTTMAEENQSQLHHGQEEGEAKKSWSSESLVNFPLGTNCVCSPTTHSRPSRCRHHRQPSFSGNLPSPLSANHKPSGSSELLQENKWIANYLQRTSYSGVWLSIL